MRRSQTKAGLTAGAVALVCALGVPASPALAQQAPAPAPVTYAVDVTQLPFEATAGTTTERRWGVLNGAGYRMEVPANWNGELVTYSHGFVSPLRPALETPLPPLRDYYISRGYAWASTSYSKNGYVVEEAVGETQALLGQFASLFRPATRTYATGVSMGGHVVGALIERFPDSYAGALPVCGVMGDEALYDYFLGHAAAAQTLAGADVPLPAPNDYLTAVAPEIRDTLGYGPGVTLDGGGHQLSAVTERLTGGERPLFDQAFEFWSDSAAVAGLPFLLGVYGGALTGGPATAANTFASNTGTSYQLDDDPAQSPVEEALNAAVPRRGQTTPPPFPKIQGTLGTATKVLTMHTIGDLFVPFSMQQEYRREALGKGTADRLVQRAIRDVGHCTFTPQESVRAFDDLVTWVEGGAKPAGDDIMDAAVVADRDFGCTFTQPQRPGIPACGGAPAVTRSAGADRIGTAVDLVRRSYTSADTVVLARADEYADALAGAPLAAGLDAPVLLTGGDRLPAAVLTEIRRLGATSAYVLGGPRAVSSGVEAQLAAAGITETVRLGGADRYDTARLVAEELGGTAAFVVQGSSADPTRGWADAVAVSALAAFLEQPILLVDQDRLPEATAEAVASLELEAVTVIGGEAAVSATVARQLDDVVEDVDRLAGADRYATSAAVAEASLAVGMHADRALLATGTGYADALVAGPVAAKRGSLLLLVDQSPRTVEPTVALLQARKSRIDELLVVGGPAAVPATVEAAIRRGLE